MRLLLQRDYESPSNTPPTHINCGPESPAICVDASATDSGGAGVDTVRAKDDSNAMNDRFALDWESDREFRTAAAIAIAVAVHLNRAAFSRQSK